MLGRLHDQGPEVRLILPQYVKPFVKTNKNDAADAEAICEAMMRPTMRFAPVKSAEQQAVLNLLKIVLDKVVPPPERSSF